MVKFKEESTKIMGAGGSELRKWHSNVPELNSSMTIEQDDAELTYIDWTTVRKQHETKILGVTWKKQSDKVTIDFNSCLKAAEYNTKKMLLSAIYSIYDILGLASPVIIVAKLLYSEICLRKFCWDEILPEDIIKRWKAWIKSAGRMSTYTLPRCVIGIKHKGIFLHGFSDASKDAICAAIYVTTTTKDGKAVQSLLVAKSRIAPKNQTIPRLELVASLILAKLMTHVTNALHRFIINRIVYWEDNITVLYWLDNKGT